jgi:transcriptional regulator with XRE-family HTH domain
MGDEQSRSGARDAPAIDVPGLVMRVRRSRDLSQRDLAAALGLDPSRVARLESAGRRVDLVLLAEILALAGMRIAVLDHAGAEVAPVPRDVLRDHAGRRMPAHLDVRPRHDRPTSALLHGHSDRADPLAWYHHRARRDERRLERGLGLETVPDQLTVSEMIRAERGRRVARTPEARQRVTQFGSECFCADECFERGACSSACTCGCER